MKKLLYAKSYFSRKAQFQIITTIYESHGHLFVSKKPATKQAAKHLNHILVSEKLWQKVLGNLGQVINGKLVNEAIEYKFLNQPTLDYQITNSLANKNYQLATQYFLSGIGIINRLPSHTIKKYPEDKTGQYLKYFTLPPLPEEEYLDVANLDIATDNLILTPKHNYFLDCEWLTDFPVEKKLLLYRYCLYSALKYRQLFQNFSHLSLIEFAYGQLYFPSDWLSRAFSKNDIKHNLANFFQKEESFQAYVQVNKVPQPYIGCHKVIPKPISNSYNQIKQIKSSRFYKLWSYLNKPVP